MARQSSTSRFLPWKGWLGRLLVLLLMAPAHSAAESETGAGGEDPFEGFNRAMFTFNERLDEYAVEPAARGWDAVLPYPAQEGVDNFYDNLLFPIRFVNHLLQGEIDPAAVTLSRFCVNTTLGLGGLFDPASAMDLPILRADFGQTLGRWGVPAGPYLVWPLWGSSNVRDTGGLLVDGYLGIQTFFLDLPILLGSTGLNAVNRRSLNLDTVERAREASLDLYVAARDAYAQQRAEMVLGIERAKAERESDLYFPGDVDQELP